MVISTDPEFAPISHADIVGLIWILLRMPVVVCMDEKPAIQRWNEAQDGLTAMVGRLTVEPTMSIDGTERVSTLRALNVRRGK